MPFSRRGFPAGGAALAAAGTVASAAILQAETGPIRIGIVHALSGIMGIGETTLKDVTLIQVEERNKKGGVLGRRIELVAVDPASNWPLFANRARRSRCSASPPCSAAGPRSAASRSYRCSGS